MSALGQKQTCAVQKVMSAFPESGHCTPPQQLDHATVIPNRSLRVEPRDPEASVRIALRDVRPRSLQRAWQAAFHRAGASGFGSCDEVIFSFLQSDHLCLPVLPPHQFPLPLADTTPHQPRHPPFWYRSVLDRISKPSGAAPMH